MSNTVIFIDLPNFYSRLLKSGMDEPRFIRDYFLDWLDFDIPANCLTDNFSGIWIFYSGDRIGPSSERIEGRYLIDYIRRINALRGVTARDVNIPGEQREPIKFKCEKCDHEGISESLSEKGIDSSLAVHLFDTMDSWDTAYLLSGDADYVPVVASLRRRGKIVIGAGFSDASEALVRECYHYLNLEQIFLKQDILVYKLFKKNGIVQKWFYDEIKADPQFADMPEIKLAFNWRGPNKTTDIDSITPTTEFYFVTFNFNGPIDMTTRNKMMSDLEKDYKSQIVTRKGADNNLLGYTIGNIRFHGFLAMKRRIDAFTIPISDLVINWYDNDRFRCDLTYRKNADTGNYEIDEKATN